MSQPRKSAIFHALLRACILRIALAGLISLVATRDGRSETASRTDGRMVDLTEAAVVVPPSLSGPQKKAAEILIEEVARRSGIRWVVRNRWPDSPAPVVALGRRTEAGAFAGRFAGRLAAEKGPQGAEGYQIITESGPDSVLIAGNDERGVLFGVGRLLRELRTIEGRVKLPERFGIVTSPKYPLRGHQLGYRPKTNSYDGWDLPQWERYVRELAIFGTNAVELIPPRSDDDAKSPLFPRPPMEMMVGMSRLLDDYGLDVWIWYPALDDDYSSSATVDVALKEWDEVFRKLPRVDAVFVPGGDPGHTDPRVLMPFLARVTEVLHRSHPKATMWVSPQGFNQEWIDSFLAILKQEPRWLTGIVHGPQVRIGLAELRAKVPVRYPIRSYPDITHSQQCQFPVPDWDLAFSLTEGREVINPRPVGQATIFRSYQPGSIGFISYSEGCNDDVNKFVWSALGWDPGADVAEVLHQYARSFIGEKECERFAKGLLGLEENWRGPLLENGRVGATLELFENLEKDASPATLSNWRFQQALYRACYDAFVRSRLIAETNQEKEAYEAMAEARTFGALAAIKQVERILSAKCEGERSEELRSKVRKLGEDLFLSIRMQLSVPLYDAIAVDRGANLDSMDVPLNDRLWLREQLEKIRGLKSEEDRLRALDAIVHRTDPGPGGFYDDLGNLRRQPHLVRAPGFDRDPDFRQSSIVGFGWRAGWPLAWCQNAQTLYDAPLRVRYDGLDSRSQYKVRIVYAGDSFLNLIRLDADDQEVHGWFKKPEPPVPVEFEVPPAATADGSLTLTWRQEPGKGRNGRGCQVAELWLIRKPPR